MLSERTEYNSNELKNPAQRGFKGHTEMDSSEFTPGSAPFFLHRRQRNRLGSNFGFVEKSLRRNSTNIKPTTNYNAQVRKPHHTSRLSGV